MNIEHSNEEKYVPKDFFFCIPLKKTLETRRLWTSCLLLMIKYCQEQTVEVELNQTHTDCTEINLGK